MKTLSKRHQLVVNMPYKLLHFLIKEDALSSYIENACIHCPEFSQSAQSINCAFLWDETVQGHSYWSKLNNKWYEELYKELRI